MRSKSSGLLQSHSDSEGDGPVKESLQSLLSSVIYKWQMLRGDRVQHCTQGESSVSSILLQYIVNYLAKKKNKTNNQKTNGFDDGEKTR